MSSIKQRTPLERHIMSLGWWWDLYGAGGWTHTDVVDQYGDRIAFDTPEDVAAHLEEQKQ